MEMKTDTLLMCLSQNMPPPNEKHCMVLEEKPFWRFCAAAKVTNMLTELGHTKSVSIDVV